jgi:hypothetical protein
MAFHEGHETRSASSPTFGVVALVAAAGALAGALWGYTLNIDQIAVPLGISVLGGVVAIVVSVAGLRGVSGSRSLFVLTLIIVGLALAIWGAYASELPNIYDESS